VRLSRQSRQYIGPDNIGLDKFAGLRARQVSLAVGKIVPIGTEDYPTPARRPHNSRLDFTTLHELFQITPLPWRYAFESGLNALVEEIR
jgi:dTDP-4-dehydrorhamnose reductase